MTIDPNSLVFHGLNAVNPGYLSQPTCQLRFKDGRLQQLWIIQGENFRREEWREVDDETPPPKAPATCDSIDWSHVAEGFDWMARDENEKAWLYTREPECADESWRCGGDYFRAFGFASYRRGTVDWRDSLVKRPDPIPARG